MKINFKNKHININAKRVNFFGRISGLMFKSRETESLLFEFPKPVNHAIHSLFVFFPFLAVWLNKNNKIIEARIIQSFNLSVKPKKLFNKLIEIPLNSRNLPTIKNIVGKETFK